MTFDDPGSISALSQDKFSISFNALSLFKSASSMTEISANSFEGGNPTIEKLSPPMIVNEIQAAQV